MSIKTWLITGSSRGFGRALVVAALDAGDQVVATARQPEQLVDIVERYADQVLTVAVDVTDAEAATAAVDAAVERFGRINVVVNNAGYANLAPIETAPIEDFRRQFETNFWGVYNVSRAALPALKQAGGGTIVMFSSIGGRVGQTPGLGAYQSAKFAVDGFTRALATEVAGFGIQCLVVEPSGFATDWAGSSMEVQNIPDEYEPSVGVTAERIRLGDAFRAGDPERAAEILVRVVAREHLPRHLLIGASAAERAITYSRDQIDEATAWQQVSISADFGQKYPVDLPPDSP